jgi:KDO2-lipid IV(A) lauroyltransferase
LPAGPSPLYSRPVAAKQRNRALDLLLYAALRLVAAALLCFPVNWNLRTARLIGDVLYFTSRKHRDRMRRSLRHSFPGLSDAEVVRLSRRSLQALPMLGVDVIFTPRLIRIDTWRRYLHIDNLDQIVGLLVRHKGLIMLTGHYGNWEILGYLMATLGFETVSIARPLDNPYVNEWVLGVRERMGQRVVDKKGATAEVVPVLRAGGTVAFIADQDAGKKGLFVEFFNRPASTYKSIGLLAMQFEVPVVIGASRRRGDRFEFDVVIQDVIYPDDWKGQDDPLRYITERYSKGVEDFVKADPSQYLWVHRRWKSRPKGEPAGKWD